MNVAIWAALIGAGCTGLINALLWAISWGELRNQVKSNRERQDERHDDNIVRLDRIEVTVDKIEDKVSKINGTVQLNTARIERLEWDREK